MNKVGYLIKHSVTVNGKDYEYFYLRRSDRIKGAAKNGKYPKTQINLFNFGNKKKTILQLEQWENDISQMPNSLKNLGYDLEDVKKWKSQLDDK